MNSWIFFWECHGTFLISYCNHWSFLLNFHHPGTKEIQCNSYKGFLWKECPKVARIQGMFFLTLFTMCYCELWVHSFENLKHFLFELLVDVGNECYGTFSYKPFASRLQSSSNQCFEHRLTMHLVVGGHLWSVLHIFCHKTEVKMHILFGNQGLCQALNLFFIKTRSGSHPWTTTTDQRRK